MSEPILISSSTLLNNVNQNFRVFAGPGAGKTYWLIKHIENVVRNSNRLSPESKIVCISYTNVAVNTIIERLGNIADDVEVSTIHSLLYRYIVKPYLHLLRDTNGEPLVKYEDVDGHDEHVPSYTKVKEWLGSQLLSTLTKDKDKDKEKEKEKRSKLFNLLRSISWDFDEQSQEWNIKVDYPIKYFPATRLFEYKKLYWQEGTIDHDDVLYFSHRILKENPILLHFLSAKFRYMFIDEFQDTNPVQTLLVKWLAKEGTVVGVIGDAEQSIYRFQGARYEHFRDFSVTGLADYIIEGNRRSTDSIIEFLNHMRQDGVKQIGLRKIKGAQPRLCIGETKFVAQCNRRMILHNEGATLTRKNELADTIRQLSGATNSKVWSDFEKCDQDRSRFFEKLVAAVELAHKKQYSLAMDTLRKGIRINGDGELRRHVPLKSMRKITEQQRRGIALSLLESLLSDYQHTMSESTLMAVYSRLASFVASLDIGLSMKQVKSGKFKDFAENTMYCDLAESVHLSEEYRKIRTIHKAKGVEFESVLVCLENESELNYIAYPEQVCKSDKSLEDKRVVYVAMSRAKDQLVVSTPTLHSNSEQHMINLGFIVKRCDQCDASDLMLAKAAPLLPSS